MLYLGADHAGFLVKEGIKQFLSSNGYDFIDLGTASLTSCNYAEIALKVAKEVVKNSENKGILVCGSGVGVCIAANKVDGILAGLVDQKTLAPLAVTHDQINVLCLSGRFVSLNDNLEIVKIFLNTKPLQDYHAKRLETIKEYERNRK